MGLTMPTVTSKKFFSFSPHHPSIPNMYASPQRVIQSVVKSVKTRNFGLSSKMHWVQLTAVTFTAPLPLQSAHFTETARVLFHKTASLHAHLTSILHMRIQVGRGLQLMRVYLNLLFMIPGTWSYLRANTTLLMQGFPHAVDFSSPIVG
jgi:hypothetical protein